MVDVAKYHIIRIVTQNVRNEWGEYLFKKGDIVHCTEFLGSKIWLARPLNATVHCIPRMLPESQCRQLTDSEKTRPYNTLMP